MAICSQCGGAGGQEGNYLPCNSCGGRGYGPRIDVACMACRGSGHSTQRQWNTCWKCGGGGQVADPRPATQSKQRNNTATKGSRSNTKPQSGAQPTPQWTGWNTAFTVGSYLLGAGYLSQNYGSEWETWQVFAVPAIPALLIGRYYKWLLGAALIVGILYAISQNNAP